MALDPYGYEEAVGPGADESTGSLAMWTGFGTLMLTMMGPCTCYTTNFLAIPVGAYATWAGFRATGAASGAARQMGLAGLLGGVIGFGFSALLCAVILLYVLILFAAGVAGALGA